MPEKIHNKDAKIKFNDDRHTKPALDLTRTLMRDAFNSKYSPWDVISPLAEQIKKYGALLPFDEYDEVSENVWVHVSAYLSPTAKLQSPTIICGGARIDHGAVISCSVVGAFSTVGELSVVKNSITFDRSRLCGQNSLLSSVIGYEAVLGNGSVVADTRLDGLNVTFDMPEGIYITGRGHLGAIICDGAKVGALCIINPGSVIDTGSVIYPMTSVSGYVYPYTTVQ